MRVLLDNCVDVRFARLISGHDVVHARDIGWQELSNGKLLAVAEEAGFAVLVTTDKNIRHQQNMAKRTISLITLSPRFTEFDFIASLAGQLVIQLSKDIAPGSEIVIKPKNEKRHSPFQTVRQYVNKSNLWKPTSAIVGNR